MKHVLFSLISFYFALSLQAQTTAIPDQNFEQALINLGYDTAPVNGSVPTANINTITRLSLSYKNITDLTGIEDFTALEDLNCHGNSLTQLDLSQNTALKYLDCGRNELTSLALDENTNLLKLECGYNKLTSLDVSKNTSLFSLMCHDNQLTSLNVKNGNNANFTSFNARWNENLFCIQVDDAAYSDENWDLYEDSQMFFSEDCRYGDVSYLADENFEQALIDLGYDDVIDGYVLNSSINTITALDVSNKNIANLTGIEGFTALQELNCSNNQLSSLDISQNIVLTQLDCNNNNLTNLDLSKNTGLTFLDSSNNQLASLNVKNENNTAITTFDVEKNPDLFCIEVDNSAWSTVNWTDIDATASFAEDCHYDETYVPDDNFEQALIDIGLDSAPLDNYVPTANISVIANLSTALVAKNISDLTGIEDFSSLMFLDVFGNQLTSLDVSKNTALQQIICYNNQLNGLDLSQNSNLHTLDCSNNQLTSLNLKNGNNTAITNFDVDNNPNLSCIEVDDPYWSNSNWSDIDGQHYFTEDCASGSLPAKVLLEGAYNPATGLQSEQLRLAGYIPTTSPYADALTISANVLNDGGSNGSGDAKDNIIDWVWVELRSTINGDAVQSQSALLQRDGDIVTLDGVSPISFNVTSGNYYVMISHGNHLGVVTAAAIAVNNKFIYMNTFDASVVNNGSSAMAEFGDGRYGLFSGDYDGNGQIQNSDSAGVLPLLGGVAETAANYFADMDMNGQIQNTDLNIIITNLGSAGEKMSNTVSKETGLRINAPRKQ